MGQSSVHASKFPSDISRLLLRNFGTNSPFFQVYIPLQRPPEGPSSYLVLSTLTQKFFFFSSWKSKHLLYLYFLTLSSGPLRLHAAGNRSTTFLCYTQVLNFKICLQFLLSAFWHLISLEGNHVLFMTEKIKKSNMLLICLPFLFLFLISAPFPP